MAEREYETMEKEEGIPKKIQDRNERDNKTKERVNFNKLLNINELGQM